ncbi:hypothetical protein Pan216_20400 [Planctomycetes bacterium Pan216]|uniref:DUF4214 domain-containing protein n=1 Tax=Kolteria novifilia TaxID=2527975 RepID=A0A518B2M5_9BACT|nr:hypothetical protein Pan216_20400 [Planctomycetes bacterium Pan216]
MLLNQDLDETLPMSIDARFPFRPANVASPSHRRAALPMLELLEERAVPATLFVTNADDSGPGSLRAQVEVANQMEGADEIVFASEIPTLHIQLSSGELEITDQLTINGLSQLSNVTVSGTNSSRVFNIAISDSNPIASYDVTLTNLTITNGQVTDAGADRSGGGVLVQSGNVLVDNVTFSANSVATGENFGGGALYNAAGTVAIRDSTISGNSAPFGGGIGNAAGASLTIDGSTISGNSAASYGGGGIANSGTLSITNSSAISSNIVSSSQNFGGGGIINSGGTLTIQDSTVTGNSAPFGGGIANIVDPGSGTMSYLTTTGTTFESNVTTAYGGGGVSSNATAHLSSTNFYRNTAAGNGGAFFNDGGTLTLQQQSVAKYNTAPAAGALYNSGSGTVTIDDATISSNSASSFGGGAIVSAGSLSISNSSLVSNGAPNRSGGALYNSDGATTSISFSTLDNNSAQVGGAIINNGGATLTIENSTLSNNDSTDFGGGALVNSGTLTVQNSTFSGNQAANVYGGGAIYLASGATTSLYNSTIGSNSTQGAGAGILAQNGTGDVTIVSSILSGNSATGGGDDLQANGGTLSVSYSLVEVLAGSAGTGIVSGTDGNIVGSSADLGMLTDNGGSTLTQEPSTSSPVLKAGSNPLDLLTDQRGSGFSRGTSGSVDMGAVQVTGNGGITAPPAGEVQFATPTDTALTIDLAGHLGLTTLDPSSLEISSATASGTISIIGNGVVRYVPNTGFVGYDRFSFRFTDGEGREIIQDEQRIQVAPRTSLFPQALYTIALRRNPGPSSLETIGWQRLLDEGTPRQSVVEGFTRSFEFDRLFAEELFATYLGRVGTAEEIDGLAAAIQAGAGKEAAKVGILASDEFRARFGGTDRDWIVALYGQLLDREGSVLDSEIDDWLRLLAETGSREEVVRGFLRSREYAVREVDHFYIRFLDRQRGIDEGSEWVDLVQAGNVRSVIDGLLSSDEFVAELSPLLSPITN